jgi:hypothetical protein
MIAEIAFDLGDWEQAARTLPELARPFEHRTLLAVELRRLRLAMARGDDLQAAERLERLRPVRAESIEPPFLVPFGVLQAERLRRDGDLDGAREAIEAVLDRLEHRTEDVASLGWIATAGVAVEADAAQQARDVGDVADAADALDRLRGTYAALRRRPKPADRSSTPISPWPVPTRHAPRARPTQRSPLPPQRYGRQWHARTRPRWLAGGRPRRTWLAAIASLRQQPPRPRSRRGAGWAPNGWPARSRAWRGAAGYGWTRRSTPSRPPTPRRRTTPSA